MPISSAGPNGLAEASLNFEWYATMFLRWSSLNSTGPHISLLTSWNNRSVRILDARARAVDLEDLNLFIAMTDEDGDGEVVAVKDLVDVRGTPTTGGGRILPTEPKSEDAPLIRNLRSHGCVMIGKTNLHEWAFGSTNMNTHFGTVHNPRERSRIAGGSSGGSAAAVAAGACDWAIGSDTGGSVRIPAALCGVVGFQPRLSFDSAG